MEFRFRLAAEAGIDILMWTTTSRPTHRGPWRAADFTFTFTVKWHILSLETYLGLPSHGEEVDRYVQVIEIIPNSLLRDIYLFCSFV